MSDETLPRVALPAQPSSPVTEDNATTLRTRIGGVKIVPETGKLADVMCVVQFPPGFRPSKHDHRLFWSTSGELYGLCGLPDGTYVVIPAPGKADCLSLDAVRDALLATLGEPLV